MFNFKQHEVGLILFGLDQSLQQGNTMYIRQMGKPDMDFLKNVMELESYSENKSEGGDIFDALEQSLITIDEYVKKKKYEKKIYVFTAGCGKTDYNSQQLEDLVSKIQQVNAKINIIAFDFLKKYNPENEDLDLELTKLNEDDDTQTKVQNLNQKLLLAIKREIPSQVQFYPSSIALLIQKQFRSKGYAPRVKYRGTFEISNFLKFDIQMYTKTSEDKLPGLKQYSQTVEFDKNEKSGLIEKEVLRYVQEDPNMQPVDKENVGKAYHYGKQLVPLSNIMEQEIITNRGKREGFSVQFFERKYC
ncbi:ku70 ku80 beta-barrel domain protein [Ichthyophthirius multifiliis]|uniref:Ku70 ku80 beta-barrel domain protein n=1 Tax=Ichthyophthirius multifiliis TaxID=5932 RepID=G0QS94_ICHMU|nr:ku70 ku80 beta-barrel domain protein [Ichthyophthirius multifiliis]EGR31916.1 ku70 ku80 beta-barrel domain protein [Ichthyophthirius multifiliis]|eukprot:XP_004035402.1 ku70 ku80 beta-barrel domain protein [Ichthyophthirius multifiliis]